MSTGCHQARRHYKQDAQLNVCIHRSRWIPVMSAVKYKKNPNKTNTHSPPHNFAEPAQGLAYFIRSRVMVMQPLFKIKRYWALELRFQREPLEPQRCRSLISANAARVAEPAPLSSAAVAARGPAPRPSSARGSQPCSGARPLDWDHRGQRQLLSPQPRTAMAGSDPARVTTHRL